MTNKRNNSVSGEEQVAATTANEMEILVESFNAKMKEQVREKFNNTVRFLEEQIRCEGQENKTVSLYSATLEYQSDYLYEWRKFAWEQGKVESSVAIEFYRNNVDMFINVDAMDDYVEELADEYGVDDVTLFIQGGCRIYMENPYYEEDISKTTDASEAKVANLVRRLYKDGDYRMSLLIGCCSFLGLRISDALTLSWDMISGTDNFTLIEKKTEKKRVIKINDGFQNHIRDCYKALGIQDKSEKCFADYSVQSINLILKEIKERYNLKAEHFNTHCLRKAVACG